MKIFDIFKKKAEAVVEESSFIKYDEGSLKWSDGTSEGELFSTDDLTRLYSTHWLIFSAISAKAERLSNIPFVLYDAKGEVIIDKGHPLHKLISRPNKEQTWQDFFEGTIVFLESTGNALWEIVRKNGKIQQLYNLYPNKIRLVKNNSGIAAYEYHPTDAKTTLLPLSDVIHFKYISTSSELWGMSPLVPLIPSVMMSLYLDIFIKNFFKNAGKTAGTFTTDKVLNDPIYKRFESRIEKVYQGLQNAWKPLILDGGMKYDPATFKMSEMPFGDLSKDLIMRTLAVLDVPPILIGSLEGASYANAQQQYQIFWESLISKASKIIDKVNTVLFPQMGYEGYTMELDFGNIKALVDEEKQAKTDFLYVRAQVKTPNEIRDERWGRKPLQGGDEFKPISAGVGGVEKADNDRVGYKEWVEFVKSTKADEVKMAEILAGIFAETKSDVLEKLKDGYEKRDANGIVPDQLSLIEKFAIGTMPVIMQAIGNGARLAIKEVRQLVGGVKKDVIRKEIKVEYDWNELDPVVLSWVKKHQYVFADQVVQTTIVELQSELRAGFETGETMQEIADRVSKVFEGTVRATGARAMLIARTEIITASNFGKSYTYREMGVEKKQWIASYGAMTPPRPSHDTAHRQTVGQDDMFMVGGEMAEYPGDPSLSPAERCHCRCTMKAIIERSEK